MKRPVKIIATIGPASSSAVMIASLSRAGMDLARINFSHGNYAKHKSQIDLIRRVADRRKIRIPILQDLQGYRIRIGELKSPHTLIRGQQLFLTTKPGDNKDHIPFDYEGDVREIKKGLFIYLDDGKMALQTIGHRDQAVQVRVVHEGVLQSRKGINIPGLKLKANILTPKDKDDLEFGIQNNIEFIAQSFVRNKKDILNIMDLAKGRLKRTKYIAKIENEDGLKNLESIMDVCDGIMVARGDLGISLPIYKIAMVQKDIIQRCRRRNKFVITATQMLDSMTEFNRPTRAEVSDVTNAILDGTDFCMLSAETAAGEYPIQAVRMMRQIIDFTQKADHIDI